MGCTASTAGVAQTTPKLHRRTQPDVASHRNEDNAAIVSKGGEHFYLNSPNSLFVR